MPSASRTSRGLLSSSIGGLALGILLGSVSHSTGSALLATASPYIKAAGTLWMNALSALVIPLTIVNVVTAVVHGRDARQTGLISARAFLLFVVWLALAALVAFLLVPPVLAFVSVDTQVIAAMTASLPADAVKAIQTAPPLTTPSEVISNFVPRNLFKSITNEELLPVLLFSAAFAFAVTRVKESSRAMIGAFFTALSDALLIMVAWLLRFMPIGAFSLAYVFSESAGFGVANVLGQYTLISCAALLLFTLLLYPLTAVAGGVSIGAFARAVLPAQIAAVSTRSSIAALPALLDGASRELRMSPDVANLTLPLSVAVFKVNRTVTSTVKVLFIAHIFGVQLGVAQLLIFTVSIMILSFTSLGVPGGGAAFKSMAVYLAVGIPIEGYVLLEATDVIVDIFKTLLNVTGDMSVASVVERMTRRQRVVRDDPLAVIPDMAA